MNLSNIINYNSDILDHILSYTIWSVYNVNIKMRESEKRLISFHRTKLYNKYNDFLDALYYSDYDAAYYMIKYNNYFNDVTMYKYVIGANICIRYNKKKLLYNLIARMDFKCLPNAMLSFAKNSIILDNIDMMKYILRYGIYDINTILIIATTYGRFGIIKYIIEYYHITNLNHILKIALKYNYDAIIEYINKRNIIINKQMNIYY